MKKVAVGLCGEGSSNAQANCKQEKRQGENVKTPKKCDSLTKKLTLKVGTQRAVSYQPVG